MTIIFRALLALAVALTLVGPADAQLTTKPLPLRVAIEAEPHPVHKLDLRWVVVEVKNGLRRGMPRNTIKVVKANEQPDLLLKVRAEVEVIAGKKPGDRPLMPLLSITTVVDGRTLASRVERVGLTGHQLGLDIAAILRLRTSSHTSMPAAAELDGLIAKLATRDVVVRAETMARIARLGRAGVSAAPTLVELLGDDRWLRIVGPGLSTTVGREAGKALVALGESAALVEAVRTSQSDKVRSAALWALGQTRLATAPAMIVLGLSDRSARVRDVAVAHAGLAGRAAIPGLIDVLVQSNSSSTRAVAHQILVALTGQDFGRDGRKWSEWLASSESAGR